MEYMDKAETPWERFDRLFSAIDERHSKEHKSVFAETADDEQEALDILDNLICEGNVSLYPLMALLSASNNWHTLVIVRLSHFQGILLEGIEKGSLAPDDEEGWMWLLAAADTNNPADFMVDTERFHNLLTAAIEAGNQDAISIAKLYQ